MLFLIFYKNCDRMYGTFNKGMVFLIKTRYVKNISTYVLKRIIIFLILILIASLAFSIAFNQSRVRVFVNDAFTQRADAILEKTDLEDLKNFFDEDFLAKDSVLIDNKYALYDVATYDYSLNIDHLSVGWVAPSRATVVVSERIDDITGQFAGTAEEKIGMADTPPSWENGKHKVKLKKSEGRWYIVGIEKVKDLK